MQPPRRAVAIAIAIAIAMVATVCLRQAPAQAHAILLDSLPAAGATLPAGRLALRLRYNSRIDAARSRLTLTRPDGSTATLATDPAPTPDLLVAVAELKPGAYSLRWQVLATDGHITRGDLPFTVSAVRTAP